MTEQYLIKMLRDGGRWVAKNAAYLAGKLLKHGKIRKKEIELYVSEDQKIVITLKQDEKGE